MPSLTFQYPDDAPDFIRSPAAPREWQERIQAIDRDAWVCWNPHDRHGPGWCVVRYHGRALAGIPIIRKGGSWGVLGAALASGAWSYVRAIQTPNFRPCDLNDEFLVRVYGDDLRRIYGCDPEEAIRRMQREHGEARELRQKMSDDLMHEAFEETVGLEKTRNTVFSEPRLGVGQEVHR